MGTEHIGADVASHTAVPDHFEHIFIVTGPAGCGKTTVATYLSENLKCPYVEGDDVGKIHSHRHLSDTNI